MVQVVASKLYTLPSGWLASDVRDRRSYNLPSPEYYQTNTPSHQTTAPLLHFLGTSINMKPAQMLSHITAYNDAHKGTHSCRGAATNKSSPTIHTPTLPSTSPSLSSQHTLGSSIKLKHNSEKGMMLATRGTAMHYGGRRPRASSATMWLDRASPPGFVSHSASLTPTGRAVLMADPQRWLGFVWGRSKALTSVTFSTARYKSVTPEKTGTWIRQGLRDL